MLKLCKLDSNYVWIWLIQSTVAAALDKLLILPFLSSCPSHKVLANGEWKDSGQAATDSACRCRPAFTSLPATSSSGHDTGKKFQGLVPPSASPWNTGKKWTREVRSCQRSKTGCFRACFTSHLFNCNLKQLLTFEPTLLHLCLGCDRWCGR